MADLQLFQLQEQLRSMPEYKILQRLHALQVSLTVFDQNYRELKALIARITTGDVAVRITRRENRLLFEHAMVEMTRLLHNFVASAISLVHHTRRLHGGVYQEAGSFSDYQPEVTKRFTNSGLVQFIQDLRHYTMHYELPSLALITEIRDPQNETMIHRIALSRESLLKSQFRWSLKGRDFIEQHADPDIDLVRVVTCSPKTSPTENVASLG